MYYLQIWRHTSVYIYNSLNCVTCGPQKSLLGIRSVMYRKLAVLIALHNVIDFSCKTNTDHSSHAEEAKQTASNSIPNEATERRVQLR
jgi:hypothetical protein